MTGAIELHPTHCAICGTEGNAVEIYAPNFTEAAFSVATFSARRLPDRIHYRVVKCKNCGLVRSDPVANQEMVDKLYSKGRFDYQGEIPHLRTTYGSYLAALQKHGAIKGTLLEIGCGNGFFLEEALTQGYASVRGVEPSADAVAHAREAIRPSIIPGVMRPGHFKDNFCDVVCMFHLLDHVPDPRALLNECTRILKKGGFVLAIAHNCNASLSKILGERSPIIDLEHAYLYSHKTIRKLFTVSGFKVRETGIVINRYSLGYYARLAPMPERLKSAITSALGKTGAGKLSMTLPLGNLYIIAQKPA